MAGYSRPGSVAHARRSGRRSILGAASGPVNPGARPVSLLGRQRRREVVPQLAIERGEQLPPPLGRRFRLVIGP